MISVPGGGYHTPDNWVIVKSYEENDVEKQNPYYRMVCSWQGGYLDGDYWQINSGVVRAEEHEDMPGRLKFYTRSGACYDVYADHYRRTPTMGEVIGRLETYFNEELVLEDCNWLEFEW